MTSIVPIPGGATPLEPLKVTCLSEDCENNLHCFLATKQLRAANQVGRCRYCNIDLIDWSRVQRRDPNDVTFTFQAMRNEYIRHYFWHVPFDARAINYARRKGRRRLGEAVRKRLQTAIGGAAPYRDGRQTPLHPTPNPIHYAQHATATCCRRCVQEWHGIPEGRPLTDEELQYLAALAMQYLNERLTLTEAGERVPPIHVETPRPR
jgi:hypothetical protein